jgi:hypothetical protein
MSTITLAIRPPPPPRETAREYAGFYLRSALAQLVNAKAKLAEHGKPHEIRRLGRMIADARRLVEQLKPEPAPRRIRVPPNYRRQEVSPR